MKNIFKRLALVFITAAIALTATGCGVSITFDPNGGEIVSGESTVKFKKKTEIIAPSVIREGYVFAGWDREFSNPTENITVSALWDKLHTVIFDAQGGEITDGVSAVQRVTENDKITYPAVSRDGYVFDKWSTDAEYVSGDTVIKAEWKKLYTVTFDVNGGVAAEGSALVQLVAEGDAAKAPEVSREYKSLGGWDTPFDNVTGDITVKALWEHRVLTSSEMYTYVSPVTVEVNTYRFGVEESLGTGFFITNDGQVVTNFHVIEDATEIRVKTGDGKEGKVTQIIAWDADKDIAVLQTDLKDTPCLDMRKDGIKTGEVVFALGSSLGLSGTFTMGIVSTASREIDGVTYIQSTAQISKGNSGGPLVDEMGYVIGINSMYATDGQNINFSIPVSRVDELEKRPTDIEKWAELLGYSEYKFGENYITESDSASSVSYQGIQNGDTVRATIAAGGDIDYFYLEKSEIDRVSKDGKVCDIGVFMAVNDYSLLPEVASYLTVISYNTETNEVSALKNEYYFDIVERDGLYIVYFVIHDAASLYKDGTAVALQVAASVKTERVYYAYILTYECDGQCFGQTNQA